MFESDVVTNRDDPTGTDASVPGSCTIEEARAGDEALADLLDAVTSYRSVGSSVLDADQLRGRVVGLTALVAAAEAARFEAIGSLAGSGAWEADGSATVAGWIARWTPLDRPAAARDVRCAKHLALVPLVADALAAGRITAAAARMLAAAAATDPSEFGEVEPAMLAVAELTELRYLRNLLREWTESVTPSTSGDDETYEQYVARRGLHLSTSLDGVVYLRGQLDPVTGAELKALIDARVAKAWRDRRDGREAAAKTAREQGLDYVAEDEPTPEQARIDALMDITRAGADTLARPDAPDDLRTPALSSAVTVIIAARDLRLPPPARPLATPDELDALPSPPGCRAGHDAGGGVDGWRRIQRTTTRSAASMVGSDPVTGPVDAATTSTADHHAALTPLTIGDTDLLVPRCEASALLCDCTVRRAITGTHSEPLDVGRAHRTATPAIRTALHIRDRGCVFPGCRRPATWCDAHHIDPWDPTGETSVANMALLCRHHHTLLHRPNPWAIHMDTDGHPTITHNGHPQPRNPRPVRLDDLPRGKPPDRVAA